MPAVLMMGSTLVAMVSNLADFAPGGTKPDGLLLGVGAALVLLGLWLLVEAVLALRRPAR